jgi:hypothetical protein
MRGKEDIRQLVTVSRRVDVNVGIMVEVVMIWVGC